MTLNITISNDQNQSYGLQITSVTEQAGQFDELNCEAELQPGECVNVVLWDGKDYLLSEIPKVTETE